MWILRAIDPLCTPIVQRRSFLFKLQIIRSTGILTGHYNLIINLNEAAGMIGSLVVLTGSFL